MDEFAIEMQARVLRFNRERLEDVPGESPDEWGSATEKKKAFYRGIIRTMNERRMHGGYAPPLAPSLLRRWLMRLTGCYIR